MKIALIGLGVISNVHLKVLKVLNKNLVAICDSCENKRSLYPEVNFYTDYKKMFQAEDLDVVHICTPHFTHADIIIEALKRDINVLCEKPLCINFEQMQEIMKVEKLSKACLGVVYQNRYNPASKFIKDFLKDKEILFSSGKIMWKRDAKYYSQDAWRGKKNTEGGGVLINQAIHTLDLLQWIVGMPKSIVAKCENLALKDIVEVEDTARIVGYGENNFIFTATNSADKDYPIELIFYTPEYEVRMVGDSVFINGKEKQFENPWENYGKPEYGSGHTALILDFYNCLKAGKKFEIDALESSKALKIVLNAYKSNGSKIFIE